MSSEKERDSLKVKRAKFFSLYISQTHTLTHSQKNKLHLCNKKKQQQQIVRSNNKFA